MLLVLLLGENAHILSFVAAAKTLNVRSILRISIAVIYRSVVRNASSLRLCLASPSIVNRPTQQQHNSQQGNPRDRIGFKILQRG